MSSIIQKPTKKPSRFDQALDHVKESAMNNTASEKTESVIKEKQIRTNFDCPQSLKTDIDIFIANHKHKFKTNKDFYLQCIKDGLEKYKD